MYTWIVSDRLVVIYRVIILCVAIMMMIVAVATPVR